MAQTKHQTLTPDLCVVGAGSAGLSVAAAARAFGASVVLIEKGRMGGDCLNTGCVPSKSLIAAARHAHAGVRGSALGVNFASPDIDFAKVAAHIATTIADIAPHDSQERFEKLGATVIRDVARFADARTLLAGPYRVRARRFVIATGSHPQIPPIPGLEDVPYLNNENLFALTERPKHLGVIGGGPIGMEMAQSFVRLGAKVTLFDMIVPLSGDDPELATIVRQALEQEGVDIKSPARVTGVSRQGDDIVLAYAHKEHRGELAVSHLLVATGRVPTLAGLDLDKAGIEAGPGGIKVDQGLRTSNRRVFAIGDVTGGRQFTHAANYEAGLVIRSALFGLKVRNDAAVLPWCTYTDPELAGVGLNQAEAEKRYGGKVRVLTAEFAENDRARTQRATKGMVKLIAGPRGRLLGAAVAGPEAGELIGFLSFALSRKASMRHLAGFVAPYPTLTEAVKRAAISYYSEIGSSPLLGAWRRLMRLFP